MRNQLQLFGSVPLPLPPDTNLTRASRPVRNARPASTAARGPRHLGPNSSRRWTRPSGALPHPSRIRVGTGRGGSSGAILPLNHARRGGYGSSHLLVNGRARVGGVDGRRRGKPRSAIIPLHRHLVAKGSLALPDLRRFGASGPCGVFPHRCGLAAAWVCAINFPPISTRCPLPRHSAHSIPAISPVP
jgi:hypothetical protein